MLNYVYVLVKTLIRNMYYYIYKKRNARNEILKRNCYIVELKHDDKLWKFITCFTQSKHLRNYVL